MGLKISLLVVSGGVSYSALYLKALQAPLRVCNPDNPSMRLK